MTAPASALPPVHAPYAGGDPQTALKEAERIIADSITNAPRSLQVAIGPSEIGNPCDHCLAAQLAGWEQNAELGWLPFIGTAVHSALEVFFIEHENHRNANHTTGRRYLTEHKVMVGQVAGVDMWGTCDLFDTVTGMTVDWKIVGITTLRAAKKAPKPEHRVQAHLYGRGWVNAGYRVDHVSIAHLPRNEQSMTRAVWWHEPYDEHVATNALARATQFAVNLDALVTAGTEVRDAWIRNLPRAEGCFDCPRYPDRPAGMTTPGHRPPGDQLAGLIDSPAPTGARG